MRKHRDDGAVAVEFALVFPLALLLIGFILAAALYAFWSAMSADVTRDAARHESIQLSDGIGYPSTSALKTYAEGRLGGVLGTPNEVQTVFTLCSGPHNKHCTTETTASGENDNLGQGDMAEVTLTYPVPGIGALTGLVNAVPGLGDLNLSGLDHVSHTVQVMLE
jgi:Flp pilus assembly protein TadG